MKKDRMKEMLEGLRVWINVLKEFTHDKDCSSKAGCPMDHEKCLKNLTLTTSIAWEVAEWLEILFERLDKLSDYFSFLGFFSETRRKEHLQEISEFIAQVCCVNEAMISVLSRHLISYGKNRELYDYLKELRYFIYEIDLDLATKRKGGQYEI